MSAGLRQRHLPYYEPTTEVDGRELISWYLESITHFPTQELRVQRLLELLAERWTKKIERFRAMILCYLAEPCKPLFDVLFREPLPSIRFRASLLSWMLTRYDRLSRPQYYSLMGRRDPHTSFLVCCVLRWFPDPHFITTFLQSPRPQQMNHLDLLLGLTSTLPELNDIVSVPYLIFLATHSKCRAGASLARMTILYAHPRSTELLALLLRHKMFVMPPEMILLFPHHFEHQCQAYREYGVSIRYSPPDISSWPTSLQGLYFYTNTEIAFLRKTTRTVVPEAYQSMLKQYYQTLFQSLLHSPLAKDVLSSFVDVLLK